MGSIGGSFLCGLMPRNGSVGRSSIDRAARVRRVRPAVVGRRTPGSARVVEDLHHGGVRGRAPERSGQGIGAVVTGPHRRATATAGSADSPETASSASPSRSPSRSDVERGRPVRWRGRAISTARTSVGGAGSPPSACAGPAGGAGRFAMQSNVRGRPGRPARSSASTTCWSVRRSTRRPGPAPSQAAGTGVPVRAHLRRSALPAAAGRRCRSSRGGGGVLADCPAEPVMNRLTAAGQELGEASGHGVR